MKEKIMENIDPVTHRSRTLEVHVRDLINQHIEETVGVRSPTHSDRTDGTDDGWGGSVREVLLPPSCDSLSSIFSNPKP